MCSSKLVSEMTTKYLHVSFVGAGRSHGLAGKTILRMYLMVRVHLAAVCEITITNGA